MSALRGLIASLGAGVSLAAAGALALLAVSAVVGFQGWPGLGADAGRTLELRGTPRSVPAEPEDEGPVLLADAPDEDASAPPADFAPPAEPVGGDGPQPVVGGPAPVADRRDIDITVVEPGPPASPNPPTTTRPPAPQAEPAPGLTGLTGDVLRTTGETLSPVTDTLLPGSGATVEGLTDDLGDTVESTGGALGVTLNLILVGR